MKKRFMAIALSVFLLMGTLTGCGSKKVTLGDFLKDSEVYYNPTSGDTKVDYDFETSSLLDDYYEEELIEEDFAGKGSFSQVFLRNKNLIDADIVYELNELKIGEDETYDSIAVPFKIRGESFQIGNSGIISILNTLKARVEAESEENFLADMFSLITKVLSENKDGYLELDASGEEVQPLDIYSATFSQLLPSKILDFKKPLHELTQEEMDEMSEEELNSYYEFEEPEVFENAGYEDIEKITKLYNQFLLDYFGDLEVINLSKKGKEYTYTLKGGSDFQKEVENFAKYLVKNEEKIKKGLFDLEISIRELEGPVEEAKKQELKEKINKGIEDLKSKIKEASETNKEDEDLKKIEDLKFDFEYKVVMTDDNNYEFSFKFNYVADDLKKEKRDVDEDSPKIDTSEIRTFEKINFSIKGTAKINSDDIKLSDFKGEAMSIEDFISLVMSGMFGMSPEEMDDMNQTFEDSESYMEDADNENPEDLEDYEPEEPEIVIEEDEVVKNEEDGN